MKAKKEETTQSEELVKRRRKNAASDESVQVISQKESSPEETRKQPAMTIAIQSWATPIVGLVMLVIGLLGGYFLRPLTLAQSPNATIATSVAAPPAAIATTDPAVAQQNLMKAVLPKVRHFRGDPKAPVTMIEFGDFQCPFCGRYASDTEPQVEEQYVKTGKVRFGFVNFAFLGSESTWAAEAAECASDQNKYWEYHDKLYSSQGGENQGAFSKDNLKKFAQDLGLDTQTFNNCLDSGKYTSLVQQDTQLSSSLGVQSTPTFVINGQAVVGAQPFNVFQQTIDPLLK